jgi:catechol 2,3-dioxygenase-like lactoylglutathione lyase family enzyme
MLHHVSVGVRDVSRAAVFYDRVLATLGYKRVFEVMPYGIGYGDTAPALWVQLPHDKNAASVGNGAHVGLVARTKAAIVAFHREALAAGGTDDGGPGPRPDYGPEYFGAFVRDLDGNKIEAVLVANVAAPAAKNAAAKKVPAKKAARKTRGTNKRAKKRGAAKVPAKKRAANRR